MRLTNLQSSHSFNRAFLFKHLDRDVSPQFDINTQSILNFLPGIQTLYFVIIIVNMFPILAEQTIIAHTLLPVPHKGGKPIWTEGGTYSVLVLFILNLLHKACCLL